MRFVAAIDLIEETDQGSLLLPRFQRSFVWKRPDIKEFIDSVYREYPVGALATWESDKLSEGSVDGSAGGRSVRSVYLLDGQQRVTSIYGVIRGSLPPFNSGGDNLMSGLLFYVKDRKFAYDGTKEVVNNPIAFGYVSRVYFNLAAWRRKESASRQRPVCGWTTL